MLFVIAIKGTIIEFPNSVVWCDTVHNKYNRKILLLLLFICYTQSTAQHYQIASSSRVSERVNISVWNLSRSVYLRVFVYVIAVRALTVVCQARTFSI